MGGREYSFPPAFIQRVDELGAPHRFRALDVTAADAWTAVVDETVAAFGRLDALVNSAGMGIVGDIETAVRFGINSVTVVNDNHSGNQSIRGFDRVYGGKQTEKAREMWVFTEVDFAALANEIGALGIRVENPSELEPAFDRALSADRPVVIDVVTDIDALAPLAVE